MANNIIKILTYQEIENQLHGGIIPSFDFLQRIMRTDQFSEAHKLFQAVFDASAVWLTFVSEQLTANILLDEEEKAKLIEASSKTLSQTDGSP